MPKIQLPEKLYKVLTATQRLIVLIGGRGSAKSESMGRILTMKCQTEAADVLCGREFQNSIDDSVHKLLKTLIQDKLEVDGFRITDNKIDCLTGGGFRFRGFARNPEAVKSAQGFKYSWIEEAQNLSEKSIKDLTPTIREAGSQLFFTPNPQSSADPFSQRFIVPFLSEIQKNGFYEDDMHLVIMCNWRDNPWHGELEQERLWDFENLSRAEYDHIWEGAFNDSVENPLILAEWFDACIDAHLKIGFEPVGMRMASHDPSDIGPDSKGFAFRHGSVFLDVQEMIEGDVNEGCDWATGLAIQHNADAFTWDCDGLGVTLNRQVNHAFEGKHTKISQFKGSEGVDFPDNIFEPADQAKGQVQDQKTNKQALKNKRAQYYADLRSKVYRTWQMVNKKAIYEPDKLISFSSDIKALSTLRSELCRMPVKPNGNGLFELYTKEQMKQKFKFKSPNLADSVMMSGRAPQISMIATSHRPRPVKAMGRR
jgi:phage terminase large subunit